MNDLFLALWTSRHNDAPFADLKHDNNNDWTPPTATDASYCASPCS